MLDITCNRKKLSQAVKVVARGVSGRSTQPIQNNMYLSAEAGNLRMVSTDLEYTSIDMLMPVSVKQEGAITVSPKVLSKLLAALPNDEVTLQAEDKVLSLESGPAKYTLHGIPAEDFQMLPEIGEAAKLSLPQAQLHQLLSQTLFAASGNDTRPVLTGIQFTLTDGILQLVATDTWRLAKWTVAADSSSDFRVIVSTTILREVLRVLDKKSQDIVSISISPKQASFQVDTVTLASRLIEGEFPNWERILPEQEKLTKRSTFNMVELIAVLKRTLPIAREDANRVIFRSGEEEGYLEISAYDPEGAEAHEQIGATVEDGPIDVAFNANLLIDMLETTNASQVMLAYSSPLGASMLIPLGLDGYAYVVMPMRPEGRTY